MHLSNWQLCSKVFSRKVVSVCKAYSLSCRSTAIHLIHGFQSHSMLLPSLLPVSRGSMGLFGVGRKEQNKTKESQTPKICVVFVVHQSSLPGVGTPSCWNQSFGKRECARCPSLLHLSSWILSELVLGKEKEGHVRTFKCLHVFIA